MTAEFFEPPYFPSCKIISAPFSAIIAVGVFGAALLSLYLMRETFGINLDYVEEAKS